MLWLALPSTLLLVTVSKKPQQMAYVVQGTWGCRTGMMRDIVRLPGRGGSVPRGSRSVRSCSISSAGCPDPVHQLWRLAVHIQCSHPFDELYGYIVFVDADKIH